MRLLAIDTSAEAISVALRVDGALYWREQQKFSGQSKDLLPLIEQVFAEAGVAKSSLDALAFARGPGTFTGLRIACSIAQGMACALDIPVIAISSLAALAARADADCVLAAIDARMGQIYFALCLRSDGRIDMPQGERLVSPEQLQLACPLGTVGVGNAFSVYAAQMHSLRDALAEVRSDLEPHALGVMALAVPAWERGEFQRAEQALPIYVRDDVADKSRL